MDQPSVERLLDVDREYREKARAALLPKIAPRRLNPEGKAWLPVLHTRFGPWHFTAFFSNTERAHELHRTHDWVVIFSRDGEAAETQHTIVTERRGRLAGQRVVRGREPECARYYDSCLITAA
jgi:DNA polymerase (family X)